jgi:hypothetical protein
MLQEEIPSTSTSSKSLFVPDATDSTRMPRQGVKAEQAPESLRIVGPYCCLAEKYLMLKSPGLLRGASPSAVLRRIRAEPGNPPVEADYLQSQQVPKVDLFISHSWHANATLKHLAILHALNLKAALLVSSLVGLLLVALQCLLPPLHTLPCLHDAWGRHTDLCVLKPAPWSPVGGATYGATLAFYVTFFAWHRVVGAGSRWLFLDSLCINQASPAAKAAGASSESRTRNLLLPRLLLLAHQEIMSLHLAAGVRSMGAFLAHSDRMLVLWSEDYCQRCAPCVAPGT